MIQFGLIGKDLRHSFSGKYFGQKFISEGTSGQYSYLNIELAEISELIPFLLSHPQLAGFNVTIPFKESILPHLSRMSPEAREIGAVNTVFVRRLSNENLLELEGYNTDAPGFMKSLKPLLQEHHKGALILGSGGASRAVVYGLSKLGLRTLVVSRERSGAGIISYSDIGPKILQEYPVVINTTPVGTWPETGFAPALPYEYLGPDNLLFDLVYNPEETLFLRKGKDQGCVVKNGYEMLVNQAELAWKIWMDNLVSSRNP